MAKQVSREVLTSQQKSQGLQIASAIVAANQQFGILRCETAEASACIQGLRMAQRMEQVAAVVAEHPELLNLPIARAIEILIPAIKQTMADTLKEDVPVEAATAVPATPAAT